MLDVHYKDRLFVLAYSSPGDFNVDEVEEDVVGLGTSFRHHYDDLALRRTSCLLSYGCFGRWTSDYVARITEGRAEDRNGQGSQTPTIPLPGGARHPPFRCQRRLEFPAPFARLFTIWGRVRRVYALRAWLQPTARKSLRCQDSFSGLLTMPRLLIFCPVLLL